MIMSNFQMLWEEVHHRDDKIAQLRQTFSEATSYIEELKVTRGLCSAKTRTLRTSCPRRKLISSGWNNKNSI